MVRLLIKHNATEIRLIALSSFILTSLGSLSECQDAVMDAEGGRGLGRNQNQNRGLDSLAGRPGVPTSSAPGTIRPHQHHLRRNVSEIFQSIELLEINKTEKMHSEKL